MTSYASPHKAMVMALEGLQNAHPKRWRHVQAVAQKAEAIGQQLLNEDDAATLTAAAWLHDIGYTHSFLDTGLHALDGARGLKKRGIDARIVNLVAHHSLSRYEAKQKGLDKELALFPDENSILSKALLYADMTTGPDGESLSAAERLDEITKRYGPDHPVSLTIISIKPQILEIVREIEKRLSP